MFSIAELPADSQHGFQAYGGGLALWKCKAPEVILSGPAETGKTRTCLEKLDALMWRYPGSQSIIVRKTFKSLKTSVLLTFERKVLGAWDPETEIFDPKKSPVQKIGGEHAEGYIYPNGSRIYLGGMDVPDKVLSSEWDVVYINQAEELTRNDWEIITTRTTGRAGNMPYAQIIADCNPGAPTHWIRSRESLTFLESRHEDNPTLFDPITHEITEQGKKSLSVLDGLTGVRYLRLRLGKWAAAEGQVYEGFDRAVHIIPAFMIPDDWIRIRCIDFGYTNPFVCQWWALDADGRAYLYREIYMSHRIVEDHARHILALSAGESIYATIADHDAEDRATLSRYGIETLPAMKSVTLGIQAVQQRLRDAGDGKPRLYVMEGALVEPDQVLLDVRKPICTEQEWESYIWKPATAAGLSREEPEKMDDHGMDATRYFVAFVDGVSPAVDRKKTFVVEDTYAV